jgi:hypothetical protein
MAKVYNAVLPIQHKPSTKYRQFTVHTIRISLNEQRKNKEERMKKKNGKEMEYRRAGRNFTEMLQEAEGQGAKRRPKARDDADDIHDRNNDRAGLGRTYREHEHEPRPNVPLVDRIKRKKRPIYVKEKWE